MSQSYKVYFREKLYLSAQQAVLITSVTLQRPLESLKLHTFDEVCLYM